MGSLVLLMAALASATATPISQGEALSAAADRDAALRGALADVRAAEARAAEARALLQNPSLDVSAGPRRGGGEPSTDLELSLSQPLELAGQRGARRSAAAGALEAARARAAGRRLELAAEVRAAAGRALAAEEREALAGEALEAARRAAAATAERLRAGAASRLEANAARVEEGRAARERSRARRDREAALAAFELLVGGAARPAGTLADLAEGGRDPGAEADPGFSGVPGHPALQAARADVAVARAEANLASRSAVPDLRVGAAYAREEDAEILLGTVGLDLPLFGRNQGERGGAAARLARAEADLGALERRAVEELRQARLRRDAARAEVAELRGGLLQAAEENAALAVEGHEAGKLSLLEALLLRRDAADTRRALVDALEELNAAEAALALAAGAPARDGTGASPVTR